MNYDNNLSDISKYIELLDIKLGMTLNEHMVLKNDCKP